MPTASAATTGVRRPAPTQRRGHETRERILAAAAHVFARHGYSAGTTNRIAAEAGLSIGSLYQYFPNKDAVLVELVRRHLDEGTAALAARLATLAEAEAQAEPGAGTRPAIEDLIGVVVDAVLDNHVGDPRLHQVLFEEAPRPRELLDELHEIEEAAVAAVEGVLRADPAVRVADPAMAARLVVAAVESLVHRYVSSRPDDLDVAAFRGELVTMLTRYLTG
jgi:AcrR family transcriptional regulator